MKNKIETLVNYIKENTVVEIELIDVLPYILVDDLLLFIDVNNKKSSNYHNGQSLSKSHRLDNLLSAKSICLLDNSVSEIKTHGASNYMLSQYLTFAGNKLLGVNGLTLKDSFSIFIAIEKALDIYNSSHYANIENYLNSIISNTKVQRAKDEDFTPSIVVDDFVHMIHDMFKKSGKDYSKLNILDACCGKGNLSIGFIQSIIKKDASLLNNYKVTLNDYSYKSLGKAEVKMSALFPSVNKSPVQSRQGYFDTLDINQSFDLIVMNPPYSSGGTNPSIVFTLIDKCIDKLQKGGILALIVPSRVYGNGKKAISLRNRIANEFDFVDIAQYDKENGLFNGVNQSISLMVLKKK